MAFAYSSPTSPLLHSSSASSAGRRISPACYFSGSAIAIPRNSPFCKINCVPQIGFAPFAQWSGLKPMGVSISRYTVKMERKGKLKGKGVYASLFGVGAPEVLVIGVVALLVFGPKGLAEVARNMGKTIRAFQPTIKELQEVSREFKSTLEREIGLDDADQPTPNDARSNTTQPASESSGMNTEPDGSSSENVDPEAKVRADWLRGALDQLQKEQEEERQKEAIENAQGEAEQQTPAQDTPQASDEFQEASLATPSVNPSPNSLQEVASAAAAAPTDAPTPKLETEV